MKIVRLTGGAGNQMFQYAFGQALGGEVFYDISFFEKKRASRHYELNFFNISPTLLNGAQMKKYQQNFFSRLFGSKTKLPFIREEPLHVYNPEYLKIKEGIIDGYFQNTQYFEQIREKLLKEFTFKAPLNQENTQMLQKIKSSMSVSVHIRHGDYLNLRRIYHICPITYYQKAIAYIKEHYPSAKFFFFSDDIPWVKENIKGDFDCEYVDINTGKNSICDLWLMKHCKHNIIANSTFSWWGAWLNENENKIVIAPKEWFSDGRTTDIIPADWLKF